MYIPKYYQNKDWETVKQFINQNGFAVLINTVEGKPWATHIPLLLSEDGSKLSGHISKGNKQWKSFNENDDVLAIFQGPHTYISSSWYDHENVPTWNYIAVHVYGKIKILEGEDLYQSLKQLVDKYEKHSAKPVSVETMTPKLLQADLRAIVGFEIEITNVESAYKLSQNRDRKNHDAIINELAKRGDYNSVEIASIMKKNQ